MRRRNVARVGSLFLREASSHPVRYAELPGSQHTFDMVNWLRYSSYSLRYSQIIEAVATSCDWLTDRTT